MIGITTAVLWFVIAVVFKDHQVPFIGLCILSFVGMLVGVTIGSFMPSSYFSLMLLGIIYYTILYFGLDFIFGYKNIRRRIIVLTIHFITISSIALISIKLYKWVLN